MSEEPVKVHQDYRECEGCEIPFMADPTDPRKLCPGCEHRPIVIDPAIRAKFELEMERAIRTHHK